MPKSTTSTNDKRSCVSETDIESLPLSADASVKENANSVPLRSWFVNFQVGTVNTIYPECDVTSPKSTGHGKCETQTKKLTTETSLGGTPETGPVV
jgi:hypothetical protein